MLERAFGRHKSLAIACENDARMMRIVLSLENDAGVS